MNRKNEKNIFFDTGVAEEYDRYYQTESGRAIDRIEKKMMADLLNGLPRQNLLEAGCGTGHWTRFFSDAGFQITAVDSSEAMLQRARTKAIQNTVFEKADASRLPYKNNQFPVVASITMLEFVNDVSRVLEEIQRVLQPGGTFLLGCLNERSELGKNRENDPVFKDARFFSPGEIEQMLLPFGRPEIQTGVFFSPAFELLDNTPQQANVEPAFIAAAVKNQKS